MNGSINVSTSPGVQMAGSFTSSSGMEEAQQQWNIKAISQVEHSHENEEYSRGIKWMYAHNPDSSPVSNKDFEEKPTFLLEYSKGTFALPLLKVEVLIFWSFEPKSKQHNYKLPANLNFIQCALMETRLQPLLQRTVTAFDNSYQDAKHTFSFGSAGGSKEFKPKKLFIPPEYHSTLEICIKEAIKGRVEPFIVNENIGELYSVFI